VVANDTTIEAVTSIGPSAVAVEFATPEGFEAYPGQFVKLSAEIDGEEMASMYTVSSPDMIETFETTVAVDPEGDMGPWLASAQPGTSVTVSGPFGRAHYENEPRTIVLCGGPGIGPAVAIAERTVQDGGDSAIVYRNDEPLHKSRLKSLQEGGVTVTLLDTDDNLIDAIEGVVSGSSDEQVFIYGFETFVESAQQSLDTLETPRDPKIENFG